MAVCSSSTIAASSMVLSISVICLCSFNIFNTLRYLSYDSIPLNGIFGFNIFITVFCVTEIILNRKLHMNFTISSHESLSFAIASSVKFVTACSCMIVAVYESNTIFAIIFLLLVVSWFLTNYLAILKNVERLKILHENPQAQLSASSSLDGNALLRSVSSIITPFSGRTSTPETNISMAPEDVRTSFHEVDPITRTISDAGAILLSSYLVLKSTGFLSGQNSDPKWITCFAIFIVTICIADILICWILCESMFEDFRLAGVKQDMISVILLFRFLTIFGCLLTAVFQERSIFIAISLFLNGNYIVSIYDLLT